MTIVAEQSMSTLERQLGEARAEAEFWKRFAMAKTHPLRVRILEELRIGIASPAMLSRSLDAPLGNVSYHVKVLREDGEIELVRAAPVRGALEHFYRAAPLSVIE